MDFASRRHLINVSRTPCMSQALSPMAFHGDVVVHPSSTTNFPLIPIIVIGMLATSFFLMGYYIFVVKCCLNWTRVDLARVRRFSLSWQREEPFASEPRGLEEAVIRSIPVIHYKTERDRDFGGERSICECVVCLNEFHEDEKLRVIPNCGHVFHIDCIDIWLQNNVSCPLCRRCIFLTSQTHVDQLLMTPRPSPQYQSQNGDNLIGGDGDFVVIVLDEEHEGEQNLQGRKERSKDLELPAGPIGPSQRKLEQRILKKKARKLHKMISMEDGAKDDEFSVQPIRRSFSMELSVHT